MNLILDFDINKLQENSNFENVSALFYGIKRLYMIAEVE